MKPAAEGVLQKWPVSKRVNSSRAPDDDASLIEAIDEDARVKRAYLVANEDIAIGAAAFSTYSRYEWRASCR